MAGRNLSSDEIRWILSVDAQGAQGEIQSFASEIQRLKKENQELVSYTKEANTSLKENEKTLAKLEKQGKQNTNQYKSLTKVIQRTKNDIAENTRDIEANIKAIDAQNKKIQEVVKTLKVEEMTMSQLRQRASDLQKQLDRTAKSTSPESYAKLGKELNAVRGRMNQLKQSTVELNKEAGKTGKFLKNAFSVVIGNLMTKALQGFKKLISAAKEFIAEGVRMAATAEGVANAFNNIDQPGLLKNLRKETGGLINDFKLMQAAVRAENFRIPMEQLGVMLRFAQQRANETGESVEELSNKIIDGIGKKSPKAFTALGISAERFQNEVKKSGDFTAAAMKIINDEITKQGKMAETAADRIQQKTVALENAKLKLGQRLMWISDAWTKLATDTLVSLNQALETTNERFNNQISKVEELERTLPDLVNEYHNLTSKTELSKDEHERLKTVISQIIALVPGAVTEFDRYGNAIALSTEKVWEFVEAEKAKLAYLNKETIKKTAKDVDDLTQKYNNLLEAKKRGGRTVSSLGSGGVVTDTFVKYTEDELREINKEIESTGKDLKGAEESLKDLTGVALEEQAKQLEAQRRFNAMNEHELEQYISNLENAADEYYQIIKKMYEDQQNMASGKPPKADADASSDASTPGGSSKGSPSTPADTALRKQMQQRLQIIDNAIEQEKNLYKKQYLEGAVAEQEYNDRIEALTIAALQKKMDVAGQEEQAYIRYQAQILDMQIKQQEAADKQLLQELTKVRDEKLEIINSTRNAELERLQATETDQKLYALRAQEIELNTAAAREAIVKEYGEVLEKAEFNNMQNREKAIEGNAKLIIEAEKKTLNERAELNRKYAKTEADFDRLYNLRNWEQRRADEMALLARYRNENLMTEETYLAAVHALDKKYNDEKLKARQQAMTESIKESFNAELENLKDLHEQKLLSDKEYEEAVFRMRMKYAARYAQQYVDVLNQTAGIVSDLMSAEITNVETRYDAEIAAAGKNKQEVERLEMEKAKKKLEIEKKYADVQFAITAAQIIAQTAMAVMQAFAQLGPIAGAIAGAIVSIAGTAQLIAANAQRKKVKSMTLASAGSEAPPTGKITMREGFAEGGYNSGDGGAPSKNADYTPGGYTPPGAKYEQAGWLPVHSGEYVVAQDEMARPDVVEKVRAIERIRRQRTSKNVAGFAEGGYNEPAQQTNDERKTERKTFENLAKVVQKLIDGDITVNYGITEMEAQQRRKQHVESIFTAQ